MPRKCCLFCLLLVCILVPLAPPYTTISQFASVQCAIEPDAQGEYGCLLQSLTSSREMYNVDQVHYI